MVNLVGNPSAGSLWKFMKKPIYYIAVSILVFDYFGFFLYNLFSFEDHLIVPFILGTVFFLPSIVFFFAFRGGISSLTGGQKKRLLPAAFSFIGVLFIVFLVFMVLRDSTVIKSIPFYVIISLLILYLAWYYSLLNKVFFEDRLDISCILSIHFVGAFFGTMVFYLEVVCSTLLELIFEDLFDNRIILLLAILTPFILLTLLALKLIWKIIEKEPPLAEVFQSFTSD